MRKKIATLLLSFALLIPCILSFSACDKEKEKAKVTSITVELVSTDYTMTDNTITIPYGKKVELDEDDFKVTATLEDNTTAEIHKKTETSDGYDFASTIPSDGITPRGDYTITFSHAQIESNVKVNVKVVSANVDMSAVSWDYSNSFTYDKTAKQVSLTGLPEGVTVQYKTRLATDTTEGTSGNSATIVGNYITTAIFTYIDTENYEAIPNKELTWEIKKADINISSSDIVMENYTYDGTKKTATIKTTPSNITSNIVGGDTVGTNAGKYTVTLSFEYTGEDKDNYNPISNTSVDWNILPQVISTTNNVTLQQTSFDYDSNEHETHVNLGELNSYFTGENPILSYSIEENKKTNAGMYSAIITITINDSNYTVDSARLVKSWQINKATLTVKVNDGSYVYGSDGGNGATITGYKGNDENLLEDYINYYLSIKTGTLEENLFVEKTTGVFEVGEYVYRASGLDGLTNYTPNYIDGTMTITKRALKLSVNSKTNEGGMDDRANCLALTYTGNAQGYTGADVTVIEGLVYGNTASNIGLQFEYKECNFEIVESENWACKFTEKSGAEWSDSAPINAGAYFVRAKDNLKNYSLSTDCTIGKMYIKKAPIKLAIDNMIEDYGITQSDIGVTYTLGGELYYNVGYDYYTLTGVCDENPGYDYVSDATFDGISSQINSYLAYIFGNWQDSEDEQTFEECDWEGCASVGSYVIRLNDSAMTNLNENFSNFEFVIVDGNLTINRKVIAIDNENSKWTIDGDDITEYVEDNGYWCATREASSEAFAISFVCDKYSEILDIDYTITNGNADTVQSISTAGEYAVCATITIKTGYDYALNYYLIPNSEEDTIATLMVTVYNNYFQTTSSGDGESAIAVTVTTTDSTTGDSIDAPLTFNEFASKTEFNEGDTFSFTLLNDIANIANSEPEPEPEDPEDPDSGVASISAMGASDEDEVVLITYRVFFNGDLITPNEYGVYTIYIEQEGTGLVIKVVDNSGEGESEVEIFAKRNFKIKRISGSGGENELPQIDLPDTYKIGDKDIETRLEANPYYKLSANQTTITITIDEKYVGVGLYFFVNEITSYEITSTTMTIDVYSMIGVGGSIALGTYVEMYGQNAKYICSCYATIVPWSEIKTITSTYLDLNTNEVKTKTEVFMGFSAGIGRSIYMSDYLLLGISVEFEDGYSRYSYAVKERDHTTNYDYTNISLESPYRKFYIVVYDADKKEIGTIEGTVYYDVSCIETNKWDSNGQLTSFDVELFTCDLSYANKIYKVSFREEIFDGDGNPTGEYDGYHEDIDFQSEVKHHSDDNYVSYITLSYGINQIDWKMTITYNNITYTYTKSFVVYMQADDSVEIIKKLLRCNEEDAYSYLSYKGEKLTMDIPSTKVRIQEQNGALLPVTRWDEVSIEDFALTVGYIDFWSSTPDDNGNYTLYENVEATIKGDPEFETMFGCKFIKYTLEYELDGKQIETVVYIRLMLEGELDTDMGYDAVVADNRTLKNIDYYVDASSINIACSTQSLSVDTDNYHATITIKDENGAVLITKEGYLSEYTFKASGTYTMTITATDGSTKDITINVTGNYVPDVKVAIKADGDSNDKSFVADIVDGNGTSVTKSSDFAISVNDQMVYSFVAYAGANHGFKITESDGKRYLSITSFASAWYTALYKMDGTKITSYPVSLEILTDDSGDEYVCAYVERIRGIKQNITIYLCDKVHHLDFEIKTDKSDDADAEDLCLTGDIVDFEEMSMDGEFQVMVTNMYGPMFVAFLGDLSDLNLDITTTDGVDYVTLNKIKSSVFTTFYDAEGTSLSKGSTLQIIEYDGIKYLLIVGAMGEDMDEQMVIAIFFCEESELPDDFFEISGDGDQGPSDPSDPQEPGDPNDSDNSNNQDALMGINASTGAENILIALNLDSENSGYFATSDDQKVQDLEAGYESESSAILIKCNYIVHSLESLEEGNTVSIAISLCDEWASAEGWKILASGDESDPKDITFEVDQTTEINAKLAMYTDLDSLTSEDEGIQMPYFAFVLSNETLGISVSFTIVCLQHQMMLKCKKYKKVHK